MSTSYDLERTKFQSRLDSTANGSVVQLSPQEFPGPVVIKRPLVLEGNGATIWNYTGPVISSQVDGVVLRNVKIEVTGATEAGQSKDGCALWVKPGSNIQFENVEVRGSVIGLWQEEGEWRYPNALLLGPLPFGSEHDLIVRLYVPVPCEIKSNISGVELQPQHLVAGTNEVHLHVERLPQDTLLNGSLFITTPQLKRRITVSAHITSTRAKKSKTVKKTARVVWQPADWDALVALPPPLPPQPPISAPSGPYHDPDIISPPITPPMVTHEPTPSLPRDNVYPPPVVPPVTTVTDNPAQTTIVVDPPPVQVPTLPPPGKDISTPPPVVPPPKPQPKWLVPAALAVAGVVLLGAAVWWFFPSGGACAPTSLKAFLDRPYSEHNAPVNAVAFSPDGTLVASGDGEKGGLDGTLKLWDASTGKMSKTLKQGGPITSVAFSPDGKLLASGSDNASFVVWDTQTGDKKPAGRPEMPVSVVAFTPDGKFVVACGTDSIGTVKFYDAQKGTEDKGNIKHLSPVRAAAFSPDGKLFATGGEDGSIQIWDAATRLQKQKMSSAHSGPVTALAFSPDSTILASGGADTNIILWDAQKGSKRAPLGRHSKDVTSVAFTHDGKWLISGGLDTTVKVWDVTKGEYANALTNNQTAVNSVAVSSLGTVASASADKTVFLWSCK